MDIEKVILFQIYLNSIFGDNKLSLSEFSEKFLKEEIKNSLNISISKLKFASAVEILENNEIMYSTDASGLLSALFELRIHSLNFTLQSNCFAHSNLSLDLYLS